MQVKDDLYALVPKGFEENLAYRARMVRSAATDVQQRNDLWIMCKKSPLYYFNVFCWLFEPRTAKVLPFITYDFQDDLITEVLNCIGKYDLVIPKSRDMGVSWCCLTALEWLWHFHDYQTFLLLSRKEELVDKRGDPKELFYKIDFLHEHQPKWLLPTINRMKMLKENLDNKSVLGGESTNEFAGVADRKRGLFLDEYSKMDNQDSILRGTRDVTESRIFVFTPEGSHNKAYDIAHNDKFKTMELHWTLHPTKNLGLYKVTNGVLEVIDKKWHEANPGYAFVYDGPFFKNGKPRSPFYDAACNRADHPMEIAQELDIDYLGSDFQYFQGGEIEQLIRDHSHNPFMVGDLQFDTCSLLEGKFIAHEKGKLKLWMYTDVHGEPARDRSYTIGADIAAGTGATNSVLCIGDNKTGEEVGVYANSRIRPEAFADLAVAFCNWLSGPNGPAYLIWEAPGPGNNFRDRVLETGFRNFFYRAQEDSITRKPTLKPGWWPTVDTKTALLGEYRRVMLNGQWVVKCREEYDECKHYIFTEAQGITHSGAINTPDPSGAKHNHGDRPMASALCWKGMKSRKPTIKEVKPEILADSFAWRKLEAEKALLLKEAW